MTPATSSVAAFVVELPAERFVEDLFPPLAWAATVQLADAVIGSRLVERVLRKAWDEREQFATPELLYQHVRSAARAAIASEAARRFETVRFDDAASMPLPGDLHAMTLESVQRRFQGESPRGSSSPAVARPAVAPAIAVQTVAAPVPAPLSAPVSAMTAPVPPTPLQPQGHARSAVETVAASSPHAQPQALPSSARDSGQSVYDHRSNGHTPSTSSAPTPAASTPAASTPPVAAPLSTVARWAAKSAGHAAHTPATANNGHGGLPNHASSKGHHLRAADYIKQHEGGRLSPRIIGAVAVVVAVALILIWRAASATPLVEQAVAALADTSGVLSATTRAQQRDVMLPDGASVHLGPEATLQSSSGFADGARAMHVLGPAVVFIRVDSTKPTAIASGSHRWMTYGVSAAFDQVGSKTLVHVDSGSLELIVDSARTRVVAGNTVAVDASAGVTVLSPAERDAAFSWRNGRLTLTRQPSQRIVEEVSQWFELGVRFTPARAASDSLSIDVPLSGIDSLVAALGLAVGGTAERIGQQLTVSAASPPSAVSSRMAGSDRSRSQGKLPLKPPARGFKGLSVVPDLTLPEIKIPNAVTKPPL